MPPILCPLDRAAKQFGPFPAIISKDRTISYYELNSIVNRAAQRLLKQGIKGGSRAAITSPACSDYLVVLLALWRVGAIGCPVSPRYPKPLVKKLLRLIRADRVLTQRDLRRLAGFGGAGKAPTPHFINPDTAATILFTSGTSATPKAVLHTYGNHYFNAKGSNENILLKPGDRWLLSLPLFHVSGMGIFFRCLLAGAAVVIPSSQKPLASAILKYRVTHLSLVSTQLQQLLEDSTTYRYLRQVKAILLGGSLIPANLIQRAIDFKLPIYKSYGLTETASQVTTTKKNELPRRLFTAGKVLRYRQLRIAKDGEIWVKGQVLCKGYFGAKGHFAFTGDGWFKTGDTGYLRADQYLVVTGRKDNMFISGGENIFPEEIEKVLLSDRRIVNAAVIPVTDPLFGARPAAFIRFAKNKSLSVFAMRKILRQQLPKFKVPDYFYAWPNRLLETRLKINRKQLIAVLKDSLDQLK